MLAAPAEGEAVATVDETLLVLINSYHEELTFTLPEAGGSAECEWELFMDTKDAAPPGAGASGASFPVESTYPLAPRALALFRRMSPNGSEATG